VQVIPVIDLKNGQVVHARRGERESYQPIRSVLCQGSHPHDVVAGLLRVYSFATLYIADLDAIQGRGDNLAAIRTVRRAFPDLELWVDNGLADAAACRAWLARDLGDLVLGSEVQRDLTTLEGLADATAHIILSLDHKDDAFLGPPELRAAPALWPPRIIAMTLSRVGSSAGPDFTLLDELGGAASGRKIFAAGGVRGGEDLRELARRGVSGVLVATALHERRIGPAEIAAAASATVPP
jgi:phosphoribosylformimino-5-aminoimidazole carboxamide ribotide isomerase